MRRPSLYVHPLRQAKYEWLLRNPDAWAGWQGRDDPRARLIVEAMRADGLVSRTAYWVDVHVGDLIEVAQRRGES